MQDPFASGRIVDLIRLRMVVEAAMLVLHHRRTGRGLPAHMQRTVRCNDRVPRDRRAARAVEHGQQFACSVATAMPDGW